MRFSPNDQVMTIEGPHTVVEQFADESAVVAIEDLTGERVVLLSSQIIGHPRHKCAMLEVLRRAELTSIANGF